MESWEQMECGFLVGFNWKMGKMSGNNNLYLLYIYICIKIRIQVKYFFYVITSIEKIDLFVCLFSNSVCVSWIFFFTQTPN